MITFDFTAFLPQRERRGNPIAAQPREAGFHGKREETVWAATKEKSLQAKQFQEMKYSGKANKGATKKL